MSPMAWLVVALLLLVAAAWCLQRLLRGRTEPFVPEGWEGRLVTGRTLVVHDDGTVTDLDTGEAGRLEP